MSRFLPVLLVLVWTGTAPHVARADVIYATGFEQPPFSPGTLARQNGWNSDIGPAANIAIQTAVVQTGTQAVGFDATGATNFTRAGRSTYFDTASRSQKVIDLQVDMYLSSGGSPSEWRITGGNGRGNFIGLALVDARGALFTFGSRVTPTGINVTRDAWHTYNLRFNFATNTFALLFDGVTVATNQPFAFTNSTAFGDVRLEVVSPRTDQAFFDNLTVTASAVPESFFIYSDSEQVGVSVPFDVFILALDESWKVLPTYEGEIAFWSTDDAAILPKPYAFQPGDGGIAFFSKGVTFRTTGSQELYVFDTATFTIFGYAVFEVMEP